MKFMKTPYAYYPFVVGILIAVLVVPIVLYYGFGIDMPYPKIR